MEDLLLIVGLLLSLYGLSCAISSFVMWLVAEKEENENLFLIPVSNEVAVKAKIAFALYQLKNSGLHKVVKVLVVDCGLSEEKKQTVQQYCFNKEIDFCKIEHLSNYLEKPSFQKP